MRYVKPKTHKVLEVYAYFVKDNRWSLIGYFEPDVGSIKEVAKVLTPSVISPDGEDFELQCAVRYIRQGMVFGSLVEASRYLSNGLTYQHLSVLYEDGDES